MLETIANLQWYWVIVICLVLLLIRFALRKSENATVKQIGELAESLAIAFGLVFLIIRPFIVQSFFIPSASMRMTLLEHDHIMVNKFVYRFLREPERGDIVVFKAPPIASPDGKERDFIKRLIGKPGDTIEVRRGYVSVNGYEFNHQDIRTILEPVTPVDKYETRVKIQDDGVLLNGKKKVNAQQFAELAGQPRAKVSFHPGIVILNGKPHNEPYAAEDSDVAFPRTKVPQGHLFMMGDNRNNSSDSRFWGPLERKRVMGKAMFIWYPFNRIGRIR
jgi:signal peptidase I